MTELGWTKTLDWGVLVQQSWLRCRGPDWPDPALERAALSDATFCIRALFAPLLAHLTGWTASRLSNPFDRLHVQSSATADIFFAPQDVALLARLETRLDGIIAARMVGYRALAVATDILRQSIASRAEVKRIETLGDPHSDGDCVRRVTLSDDHRFIYKPRSAEIEKTISSLLGAWIGTENFVLLPVFNSGKFSWWHEFEHLPEGKAPEDPQTLAWELGRALVAAIALAWDDLHFENLLFGLDGASLALGDTETVWSARLPNETEKLRGLHPIAFLGLQSQLLPAPTIRRDELTDDSPVLRLLRIPSGKAPDVWRRARRTAFDHFLQFHSRSRDWYTILEKGILAGIDDASHQLAACDIEGDIARSPLKHHNPRFVYRPTRQYFDVLRDALLINVSLGDDWEGLLWKALYAESIDNAIDPELHTRICKFELQFLREGSIPLFSTDHTDQLLCSEAVLSRSWRKDLLPSGSHLSYLRDPLGWAQLRDVVSHRVRHLYESLEAHHLNEVNCPRAFPTDDVSDSCEDGDRIAVRLWSQALQCGDGQVTFSDFGPTGHGADWTAQIVGQGLYRGAAGIGLALWTHQQDRRSAIQLPDWQQCFVDWTRRLQAMKPDAIAENEWSVAEGLFGTAYALSLINDPRCDVRTIKNSVDSAIAMSRSLDQWLEWDYIGGVAGALASYRAIAIRAGDTASNDSLDRLLAHFERVLSDGPLAKSYEIDVGERGLAHGLMGPIYALGRARHLWPDTRCGSLFDLAVSKFSDLLVRDNYCNWTNSATWCGGKLGIARALSRLGGDALEMPEWWNELRCENTGKLAHVCCGSLGRLLYDVEEHNIDQDALRQMGTELLEIAASRDFISLEALGGSITCYGFFQGIAGALYYGTYFKSGVVPPAVEMID